jgi:hypothetical protein
MTKPYSIVVLWQDGRSEIVATSHNPLELANAPMVSRNPRVINRIELHDLTGCLETVWSAEWQG